MKNILFNFKLFYFLRQLIRSGDPENGSQVEKNKVVVENKLRWEDDGGPAVEIADKIPQVAENNSPQLTDAARESLL